MRASWHEIWESADGPVSRLAPPTRVSAGATIFAACIIAPSITASGSLFIAVATVVWLMACRPKWKLVGVFFLLGLALFLPYFLLVPLIETGNLQSIRPRLLVPWSVFLRGISCMMISIATLATLSVSDLREALLRLPIPGVVSEILIQIVHQTATLLHETKGIASAIAVRNASSGYSVAWKVLFSLPKVWLPRVINRADRVASAMELRGYCGLQSSVSFPVRIYDIVTIMLAIGAIGLAVVVRLRSGS